MKHSEKSPVLSKANGQSGPSAPDAGGTVTDEIFLFCMSLLLPSSAGYAGGSPEWTGIKTLMFEPFCNDIFTVHSGQENALFSPGLDNTPRSANPTVTLTRNISLQVREYVNPGGRFLWSEFSDVYSCFMLHEILNSCRQKHVIAKDYEEKAKWLGKFSQV